MAARINNQYEERLGTERMLPLIFKMALPAVAAQFVNLLYNIVDRIYIGHIPEIGTNALAGVGVTTSLVILISSFSAIVGAGGAPLAAMAWEAAPHAQPHGLVQRTTRSSHFLATHTNYNYLYILPHWRTAGLHGPLAVRHGQTGPCRPDR